MREYIGIDIGGTKCAVVRGDESGRILEKRSFPTTDRANTLEQIFEHTRQILSDRTKAIGVSCGGPLDSKTGVILGPPNLPGWDCVPVTEHLTERFHLPAYLENDANACAVAEWRFGAGKGCENLIFLTFGTGLGAGLILDGKLYRGACGMAGEVGHVRLFPGRPHWLRESGFLRGLLQRRRTSPSTALEAPESWRTKPEPGIPGPLRSGNRPAGTLDGFWLY